jgi:hypothetical protein
VGGVERHGLELGRRDVALPRQDGVIGLVALGRLLAVLGPRRRVGGQPVERAFGTNGRPLGQTAALAAQPA